MDKSQKEGENLNFNTTERVVKVRGSIRGQPPLDKGRVRWSQ